MRPKPPARPNSRPNARPNTRPNTGSSSRPNARTNERLGSKPNPRASVSPSVPKNVLSQKSTFLSERPVFKPTIKETGVSEINDMRLNKYVAQCNIAARRKAGEIILAGEVKVNGVVVKEPGYRVKLNDIVVYKGKTIKPEEDRVYILLNKPKDTITTASDERGRKTVLDIVNRTVKTRVFPVGRLDRDTTGLLLLTNDGDLAQKMAHPSYKIKKVYHVVLNRNISMPDFEEILKGVTLEDGVAEVTKDRAVVAVRAGFQAVVLEPGSLVLSREAAGDHLDLVDRFQRNDVEDGAVVALLAERGERKTVDVELAEALARASDDRRAAAGVDLRAGQKVGKLGDVTLLSACNQQRKGGVDVVLDGAAEAGVGRIEQRRRGGYRNGLTLAAGLQGHVETEYGDCVDHQAFLPEGGEACRRNRQGVSAGKQRIDVVYARGGSHGLRLDAGEDVGGGDGGLRDCGAAGVEHRSGDRALAARLGTQMTYAQGAGKCQQGAE